MNKQPETYHLYLRDGKVYAHPPKETPLYVDENSGEHVAMPHIRERLVHNAIVRKLRK